VRSRQLVDNVTKTLKLVNICKKLIYFSAKIMCSKNACTLEFTCILGRNIKCSVIIIIIKLITYLFNKAVSVHCNKYALGFNVRFAH